MGFAGGRDDVLEAEIGGHVAVVLVCMSRVEAEDGELGECSTEELDAFGGLGVGQACEGFIAVRDSIFERLHEIGFGRFALLDAGRPLVAQNNGAEFVLSVSFVPDELSKGTHVRSRLKGIIRFGHFLGGADGGIADHGVNTFFGGDQRVVWRLRKSAGGRREDEREDQEFVHVESSWEPLQLYSAGVDLEDRGDGEVDVIGPVC